MKHSLGIIGYGTMGSWHAENVRDRIDGLEVAAVYDVNREKLEKAENDGFCAYDSLEAFLRASIDIVLVATPNNFHKELCIAALNSGKNVVCEKPVCLDLKELEEIFAAADKNGKLFTVHFNRRWDVDFDIAKNIISQNLVGKPHQVYSRLFSNRNIPGDWRTRRLSGGGFLYDWGIHMIDQALQLFGYDPISVYADLKHIYQEDVDDSIRININYKGNLSVHIVADSWTFVNESRWHISGDDGTAVIYDWGGEEGKLVRANVKRVDWTQGCVYTENGLSRTMWPRPQKEISELPLPVSPKKPNWEDFYNNVMMAVEGKAAPLVTRREIHRSLAIVMACFESAQENKVVFTDKYFEQ